MVVMLVWSGSRLGQGWGLGNEAGMGAGVGVGSRSGQGWELGLETGDRVGNGVRWGLG